MLKSLLQNKQIEALKAKDSEKLEFIRYILAQIKNAEIEKREDLTDEEINGVIAKVKKELEDSIEAAKNGSRPDLLTKYEAQKKILSSITE